MGAKNNRSQPSEVRIKYSNGEAEIDTPFTRDPHFYLENSYTPDGKPLNHSDEYKLTLTVDGAKTWLGTAVLIARAMEGNSTAKALEEKTQKKLISRLDIRNILARAAMGIAKWVDDESRDYGDKQVLDHVHFIRIIEKLAESEAKILLADDASLIFLDLVISYAIDLGAHVKTVELAAVESLRPSETVIVQLPMRSKERHKKQTPALSLRLRSSVRNGSQRTSTPGMELGLNCIPLSKKF
jgi:hypothetical protein